MRRCAVLTHEPCNGYFINRHIYLLVVHHESRNQQKALVSADAARDSSLRSVRNGYFNLSGQK